MNHSYLNILNENQRAAAICTEGPLLILAGAGSGKTSTMTSRIAYLIDNGVNPYNILAVTFTNKAAGEMRDRVEVLVGPRVEGMWIQTFHSSCLRILRSHSDRVGYMSGFVVYDSTDQKTLVKSIIKQRNIDDKKFTPAYFLSIISECKNQFITPEEYTVQNENDFRGKVIADVYTAYQRELRKNNAMDFDDLISNTVRLFRDNEDVLIKYQNKFKYIMVDEYQDTNYIQYLFIKMLAEAHNNICVVGDDDQCIYEWRGADISNILNFEKDFRNTKVVKLEQNYRSCANIINAAHSVIEKNRKRKDKKLWTQKEDGDKIIYSRADTEKDEAAYAAQEIDHLQGNVLHSDNLKFSDFAILYRTNAQSRNFEDALSARNIPYRVLGGLRYYDRKEIKDMMSYMRLILNPEDDLALVRIINEPKRGIGAKTIEKISALARGREESMLQTLCDKDIVGSFSLKASNGIKRMTEVILAYSSEKDNLRVSDIYDALLVKTGYLEALEVQKTIEADSRIENLFEFKSVIHEYEKDNPELSLEQFMEKIVLFSEVDNHNPDEDAVVLMTMHAAKGLEFPVVFIPGMEDGLFPGYRAMDRESGIEEERRLFYVGMTRAKERLYLLSASVRTLYGKTDYTKESRFLHEIDKSLLDGVLEYNRKSREGEDGYSNPDPIKPFAGLKYAKAELKNTVDMQGISFSAGDKVEHAKFGQGLILETDSRTVTVVFDSAGVKKLAKDIAPLKKI
ncbi:MAG: UvrD-helicase domain-containing protein [Eubacteriales bacterium]|nr:UvrD-helicase domain-containing protein [Eubacteriales bacterium]MDD4390727.1 UvrD-helicase domain-containing protein [Eubacteriales bacterium]